MCDGKVFYQRRGGKGKLIQTKGKLVSKCSDLLQERERDKKTCNEKEEEDSLGER